MMPAKSSLNKMNFVRLGRLFLLFLTLIVFNLSVKSATYTYNEGYGVRFGWQMFVDRLCTYPVASNGQRMQMLTYEVLEDSSYATVGVMMVTLLEDERAMMAPFDGAHKNEPKTALPIKYTGQVQVGNGDVTHLTAYDQMTARAVISSSEGLIPMKHHGSILRIECPCYRTMTVTSVTLVSNEKKIVTEASLNVLEQTMTPTSYNDSIELKIDNVEIQGGDTLVAYLMMAPTDLVDNTITIKVRDATGTVLVRTLTGLNIEAGKAYVINSRYETDAQSEITSVADHVYSSDELSGLGKPVAYAPDFLLGDIKDTELKEQSVLLGDVNMDGNVTMADANMVVNYFLGGEVHEVNMMTIDVNQDGVVTMADANMIVNIFLQSN